VDETAIETRHKVQGHKNLVECKLTKTIILDTKATSYKLGKHYNLLYNLFSAKHFQLILT